jgi:hypothetical protein
MGLINTLCYTSLFVGAYYLNLLPSSSSLFWMGFVPWAVYSVYRLSVTYNAVTPDYPNAAWSWKTGFIVERKPRQIVQDGVTYKEEVNDYKRVDFWGNLYQ